MTEIPIFHGRVRITAGFLLLLSAVLLTETERLFLKMLPAVFVHELSHIAALLAVGDGVESVTLGAKGLTLLPIGRASRPRLLFAVLMGPVSGLLLAPTLARISPVCGGYSLIFSCFNLLPCRGLDGGTAAELLFGMRAARAVSCAVSLALTLFGAAAAVRGGGALFAILGLWTFLSGGSIIEA